MPLASGTFVGPYKIVSPLGAGGMGEVYRALDSKLGREVAIKILPEAFANDPERLARFEREAKVLASLNHTHIAQIYGIEDRALVMELVEGENLRGPLPVEKALKYARQMAEALEAAHEKGIVHRDLKPANVRVTPAGVVKVLDFGLAKAADAPAGDASAVETLSLPLTHAGMMMGTAAYMSPEQAQGAAADPRGDIWSFGAVLFEMLVGKRAFPGKTVSDTLVAVMGTEPDWSALPGATPPAVRKLLRQCLRKDRQQRLQAIGDARIALEEVGADPEAPVIERRRASYLPWAAAAGVLALFAGAGWWMEWQAARTVDHPLMSLNVDPGPDAIPGINLTAAISPDGTRLVFLVQGADGKVRLAMRLLAEPQATVTVLSGTEGAYDPFFKPNGEWIGFFAGGKMRKVSVRDGAVVTICDAPLGRGAAWGEDDNIIATLDAETGIGLSRVPARGGTPPQALTNPGEKNEATHRWPQILPGGETVLFMGSKTASNYDDSSVEVLSLRTGQVKVVQPGGYFGRYLDIKKGSGTLIYIHERTLFGVPFDLDRLEVRGTPTVLLDNVAGNTQTGGGQFDFSRNGTLVYLSGKASTGNWTLGWLDHDGKTRPLLDTPELYLQPRLSPDGKRLAFSNNTDIEIYDWERGTQERLPTGQGTNYQPVWTPDGKHIVFQTQGTSHWSIQWTRADGAGEVTQLWASNERVAPYSFSHDGKLLAFTERTSKTGLDIWTLPLDTSDPEHPKPGQPVLFLRTNYDEADPVFSPDGHWIAYTSSESGGRNEIEVRPFPAGSGKYTITTGGGSFPIWSHDTLFYLGPDGRIMKTAYAAKGDSFAFEKPSAWSNAQNGSNALDRSPDGKWFVVSRLPEAEAGAQKTSVHVTFLLNFFDEVRRRIPAGK
jgi:Tol biopolymer transport system component/predicted Ser/Thr protein kinase